MCLLIKNDNFDIAEKDIICYKIFISFEKEGYRARGWDRKPIYVYPNKIYNQFALTEIDLKNGIELISKDKLEIKKSSLLRGYLVGSGVIHCKFKQTIISEKMINHDFFNNIKYIYEAKCIIPKGEKYFKSDNVLNYYYLHTASTKLFVESFEIMYDCNNFIKN